MDNNETKQTDETDIVVEEGYCENIGPNSCPTTEKLIKSDSSDGNNKNTCNCTSELHFFTSMSDKILEMFDVLVCLAIAAASSILFAFGYYYICNYRKVSALIAKLNIMERKLLVSNTEVEIFKHDLVETRNELSGSNDMVITLKRDLLNSQASTDEELQTQLKEQQKTIEEINISLSEQATNFQNEMQAEKEINENLSQELSKLHLLLSVKEPMWMKQHVFKRICTMHDEGLKTHKSALLIKFETKLIAYLVSFELQIFMNMKSIADAVAVVICQILFIIIQLIPIAVRVCRNVRTFMGRQ